MPQIDQPPEPWRSFFAEVDSLLTANVHLHCCGGFVLTQLYDVARTTSDVDFLGVVPNVRSYLTEIGGKGSALHQKAQRLPGRCHGRDAARKLRGTTGAHVSRCVASPPALRA
jgi:hypothetical protein